MADRPTVPQIEAAFRVLATDLDVPAVDLVPAVTSALAATQPRSFWLRPAAAVAAVVLAAAALVVVVEPAREAVADWLGIGSTRIEVVDSTLDLGGLPPVVDSLGIEADRAEAARVLGVAPRLPSGDLVGEPDGWLVAGSRVTAVWAASADLPEIEGTGLGLLLSQGPEGDDSLAALKQAGPGVIVEPADVNGAFGVWIEGSHLRAADGGESTVAANVLLWVDGGAEYRLESNLDRAAAMDIAETVARGD